MPSFCSTSVRACVHLVLSLYSVCLFVYLLCECVCVCCPFTPSKHFTNPNRHNNQFVFFAALWDVFRCVSLLFVFSRLPFSWALVCCCHCSTKSPTFFTLCFMVSSCSVSFTHLFLMRARSLLLLLSAFSFLVSPFFISDTNRIVFFSLTLFHSIFFLSFFGNVFESLLPFSSQKKHTFKGDAGL